MNVSESLITCNMGNQTFKNSLWEKADATLYTEGSSYTLVRVRYAGAAVVTLSEVTELSACPREHQQS